MNFDGWTVAHEAARYGRLPNHDKKESVDDWISNFYFKKAQKMYPDLMHRLMTESKENGGKIETEVEENRDRIKTTQKQKTMTSKA